MGGVFLMAVAVSTVIMGRVLSRIDGPSIPLLFAGIDERDR